MKVYNQKGKWDKWSQLANSPSRICTSFRTNSQNKEHRMKFSWINQRVLIAENELLQGGIEGTIIGAKESTIALKLSAPVHLLNGTECGHLVASARHANTSLDDILSGKPAPCALTLVPLDKFDPLNPCDVSWWRGGGAVIGDIRAAQ
jgi:hypothetical protein